MIVATTSFAAAATSRADPSELDNLQVQLGDVLADQTLNVVDANGPTTLSTSASGVSLAGAVEGGDMILTSSQSMQGAALAHASATAQGSMGVGVSLVTEAVGASGSVTLSGGSVNAEMGQTVAGNVTAGSNVAAPSGAIYEGGSISTTALGAAQGLGAEASSVRATLAQTTRGVVEAQTGLVVQYMPAPVVVSSAGVANSLSADGANATQSHTVDQSMTGGRTQASTFVASGNAWDVTAASTATANTATLTNKGSSLSVTTRQANQGHVRSEAVLSAFTFGAATAQAYGVGNSVYAGEEGPSLTLDTTQVTTGGVSTSASLEGVDGYDATASATALGNAATGYACSDCQGKMTVSNSQTSDGNVAARSTITVDGSGRALTGVATAVGNSATFFVTRPRH